MKNPLSSSLFSRTFFAIFLPTCLFAGLPLETETAHLLRKGAFEVSGATEFQTSKEGKETATPLAFEYAISDRVELLIEPVFYTAIRPKNGQQATGAGDLEVTANYLFRIENESWPAFAAAFEIKFPTANSSLIGTGKTDFAGYLIATKRLGRFDTHANLGYTIVGQPKGVTLSNLLNYAAAVEYYFSEKFQLVSEVYGNTSSLTAAEAPAGNESATTPEASGGEFVGVIGGRYYLQSKLALSLGISLDNKNAVVFAPGLSYKF